MVYPILGRYWNVSNLSFPVLTLFPASMTIDVIKHGLEWKDTPDEYDPHKMLYNRFIRWSKLGVFNNIFIELANRIPFDGSLMIGSTHLKAHRTAASLLKRGILRASWDEPKEGQIPSFMPFVTVMGVLFSSC